jgi:predicted dehydrogenase
MESITIEGMLISRRTLLASAAAALPAASAQTVRLPRKIRLGIIGWEGHPGEVTGPLERLPDVEVAAICHSDPKVLERMARSPRLTAAAKYSSYDDMLGREKLDVVGVCNNNGERAAAVLACAKAKVNTIAEKPLAITRSDFERVKSAVDSSGISLGMLLPMRFDPSYLALRKIVEDGSIGEIAQIDAQKSYKAGDRPDWFLKRSSYGSTILWIGIHMLDLMRWTSGREFTEVAGFHGHVAFPELGEMDNVTVSAFRLDNGGTATLRMDYLRPDTATTHGDDRLRLGGTKGVAEYMAATGVTLMRAGAAPTVIKDLPPRGSVFIDYLESTYLGKKPSLALKDIYAVNEVTLAAHEASEAGKTIRIRR